MKLININTLFPNLKAIRLMRVKWFNIYHCLSILNNILHYLIVKNDNSHLTYFDLHIKYCELWLDVVSVFQPQFNKINYGISMIKQRPAFGKSTSLVYDCLGIGPLFEIEEEPTEVKMITIVEMEQFWKK
eukprot:355254_1